VPGFDQAIGAPLPDTRDDLSGLRRFADNPSRPRVDRSRMVRRVNDGRQHKNPRPRVYDPDVA
jgi:hypothetical protein